MTELPKTPPPPLSANVSYTGLSLASIRRFVDALTRLETYRLFTNRYCVFGLLWGLPVPIFALGFELHATKQSLNLASLADAVANNPWLLVFIAHPLIFAVVFGALGTMAADHERRIASLVDKLARRANSDPLTGLLNHRAIHTCIEEERTRAQRSHTPFSIIMIDIDDFKRHNDTQGHVRGDEILTRIAATLTAGVRPYDRVCRYGGDEFLVLLPNTDATEAEHLAERLRAATARLPCGVTLSAGVATCDSNQPAERCVERADKRLYHAKRSGRNRIVGSSTLSTAL